MSNLNRVRLGVNIDHVATIRNARKESFPDPIKASQIVLSAGADTITAHLREDRRHINDNDIKNITNRFSNKLNLEIAGTEEMVEIALKYSPFSCCIVPEKREEITTEGGLDVVSNFKVLSGIVKRFKDSGIRTSFFLDPDENQLEKSINIGIDCIEFHVGKFCKLLNLKKIDEANDEFNKISNLSNITFNSGVEVHAGHGLDYETTKKIIEIQSLEEVNIGFFLISQSIFEGLESSVKKMVNILRER